MITFISGYIVGQLITVIVLYTGYNWYMFRKKDSNGE